MITCFLQNNDNDKDNRVTTNKGIKTYLMNRHNDKSLEQQI